MPTAMTWPAPKIRLDMRMVSRPIRPTPATTTVSPGRTRNRLSPCITTQAGSVQASISSLTPAGAR